MVFRLISGKLKGCKILLSLRDFIQYFAVFMGQFHYYRSNTRCPDNIAATLPFSAATPPDLSPVTSSPYQYTSSPTRTTLADIQQDIYDNTNIFKGSYFINIKWINYKLINCTLDTWIKMIILIIKVLEFCLQ